METMKAVRIHEYGGPDVLKYEDAPRPDPGPGELLIRVYAVGVNPLDVKVREGRYPHYALPLILGWDLSGVVEATGSGVDRLGEGDEVYSRPDTSRDGAYAEYIVVRESEVALRPRSVDHIHAAGIPLAGLTAWQALFEAANLSAGQTVLIHGAAGGVGHYAVQFAKWRGARVIGTTSGETMDFVRELGADEVIDYKQIPFENIVRDIDVVIDVVGADTQQRSWGVLKRGGILVSTVGISSPEAAAEHGVRGVAFVAHPDAAELAQIADLVDAGKVRPVVRTILPLPEAAEAHELLQHSHVQGKIVLRVD